MLSRRPATFLLLFALTACGGGGGNSSLPGVPAPPSSGGGPTTVQNVSVSILVPTAKSLTGTDRRPQYVSAGTQSAKISVNGGTGVVSNLSAASLTCKPNGSGRVCSAAVSAPVGSDTFAVSLYASTDGTGPVLSQGTVAATIVAGTANTIKLTLSGVPSSIVITLATPNPPQGTPLLGIALTANVLDAAGNAIIGPDPFTSQITLTDSDTSPNKITKIVGKTTLTSPADAANVSVDYNGGALPTPAVFSATGIASVTPAKLTPGAPSPPATTSFNDYTTYGFDAQRTIFNPNSTAITPAAIPTSGSGSGQTLHLAWQAKLGEVTSVNPNGVGEYNTQTQPIIATNIPGHRAVVFVGSSGSGNMYAYDAETGVPLWVKGLGVEQYTCNEGAVGATNFGIGGTAAYDATSKSLYVVGNYNLSNNAQGHNTLWHLDAATGTTLGSVDFSPTTVGPSELNFSHTSVTLGNGVAYVGTAATCDISSWRGRVAEISTAEPMRLVNTFFTVWDPQNTRGAGAQPWGGGGVWGWGGVSLDTSGNVFTGVGNTDDGQTNHGTIVPPFVASQGEDSGYGDAFLALSGDLHQVKASNHPINSNVFESTNLAADLDLNGTPLILKPNGAGCDTMAAIQGKSGGLYLYDTTNITAGPRATYQLSIPSYNDEFLGDPAYSSVTGLVYSPIPVGQGTIDPPGMIAINPGCGSPSVAWSSTFGPDSDSNGGSVARSAPAASAGGVVFVGTPCLADNNGGCDGDLAVSTTRSAQGNRKPLICCHSSGLGGAVWALDAATGTVLHGGLPILFTPSVLRMPPTIDGNWLYILDNAGDLYGLSIDPGTPVISAKLRTVDARSRQSWGSRPSSLKKT